MADITEIVKIKSVEKNTPKMQLMDRSRTDSFTKDTYDNAGGTLQPPSMPSGNQIVAPPGRKKTSSFQITSVTQSRLSHDGGEDSADDLDESHTEDLSSELIDCSKTTDIDNDGASSEDFSASTGVNNIDDPSNNILITGVNVSQVDPSVGVPVPVLINAALSMTSAVTTAVSADIPVAAPGVSPVVASVTELVETSDPQQQWENRFKVVKIVNSEPFNRGRWIVMDYTDPTIPTSVQPSEAKPEPPIEGVGSGNSSAGSSVHIVPGENHLPENPLVPGESIQATVTQQTTFINQPQMNTNQQQSEYSAASLNSSNAQNIGTVNSNLPSTANPLASVQQVSHSVISHVPSTDPPTVIVQEATIVPIPTEQNNVPQADKIKISKVVNKEQIPLFDNQNQDSPVLKPLLDSLPDTLGVPLKSDETTDGDDAESFLAFAAVLSGNTSPCILGVDDSQTESGHFRAATPLESYRRYSSASGSSTVAIDNKIEQAMDLVKSHLMFAVREEVDVLKEKISELVDKISQLEFENGILKASASQETLNKLSQQQPPSNTKSLNTQQSSAPQQQTGSVA